LGEIDVEVNPLALRRDFELFVPANVVGVGPQEYLHDVPVPELVGFLFEIRIGLEIERLVRIVGAGKEQVEVVECPARTHFRAEIGLWCAVGVRSEQNCRRGAP
jgi:hypothetical protein